MAACLPPLVRGKGIREEMRRNVGKGRGGVGRIGEVRKRRSRKEEEE